MTDFQIAQLNVATPRYPVDDPRMAEFMDNLDAVNAMAEATPGFVWRLVGDGNNATDLAWPAQPEMLVNMSVWTDVESLFDFVYKTAHTKFMRQRLEWFERPTGPFQTLWWVPSGHQPGLPEAVERLTGLERDGPTPHAFSFKQRFPAPDQVPATAP